MAQAGTDLIGLLAEVEIVITEVRAVLEGGEEDQAAAGSCGAFMGQAEGVTS